jgi:putative phosphoribosyl transferase
MAKHAEEERLVYVDAGGVRLEGMLSVPRGAHGIVLFAHGSGSSRLSPRNNFVAKVLRNAGLGTLLIDLLTGDEDVDYERRFDIELLTERLEQVTEWLAENDETKGLDIGYFGASTGAAAAIRASVTKASRVGAVVSRGGRTDLADDSIERMTAPTLFIVGGSDGVVVDLNERSYKALAPDVEKELVVIPGATHLFEEPGALDKVAELAAGWFAKHLGKKVS